MELSVDGRSWVVKIDGEGARHMFDINGSETFDFTECIGFCNDSLVYRTLHQGDKIEITYIGDD